MTLVTDFLDQYSPSTKPVNEQVLREFGYLIQKPVENATQDDVIAYNRSIADGSKNTIKRKLSTLSAFYKYLIRRGALNENPTVAVRVPRVDRAKTIKWLTEDEVALLSSRTYDIMHRAVLFAGLSGLRLAEIQALDVEQYRDGRLWDVLGKGDKVRTVPLTNEASQAIEAHIGDRKRGPMFRYGTSRVSRRTLQNIVYEATERALGRRINVHALRHTYATMLAKADVPVLKIGRLLGHANPAVTEIYTHLTADDLVDEVRKLDKPKIQKQKLRLVYSRVG